MSVVDSTAGTRNGHVGIDAHVGGAVAGADNFPDGQCSLDAHDPHAVGEQTTQPTKTRTTPRSVLSAGSDFPDGHGRDDAHTVPAVGEHSPPAPATAAATPTPVAPVLASTPWADSNAPLLALLADALDDLERTRIANENRLRQLTRDEPDKDGEERGFGLTLDQPQVAQLANMVTALRCGEKPRKNGCCLEHDSIKNLERVVRKHPLGPWIKAQKGVGEKQGARLLAAIGDPYWNTLYDRPRTVSELWAYCGLHVHPAAQASRDTQAVPGGGGQTHPGQSPLATQSDPAGVIKQGDPGGRCLGSARSMAGVAPTRARGQRANWSNTAKKRAWLITKTCVKNLDPACKELGDHKHHDNCPCSPYRVIYDHGRLKYADATHQHPCRRCGPAGKPAPVGSPLSPGHQEARALRLVSKELLKHLWRESKRIHEGDQP